MRITEEVSGLAAWDSLDHSYTTEGEAISVTERGRGYREDFARFFEEPSREGLRDVLRENFGEENELDFKKEWPETSKLARHVLGLANFGGGCIVVGVEEGEEGSLDPAGLAAPKDKTEVLGGLDNHLPDVLLGQVEILDFSYVDSEYPTLRGKSFQVLFVDDDPVHLPFLATRDGRHVRANKIYTRRGVSTEEANHDEVQRIVNRRLETGYSSRRELDLRTHLEQLSVLYEQVSPYKVKNLLGEMAWRNALGGISGMLMKRVPNPSYPKEDYEAFVIDLIARKKRRIEMELDVEDIPVSETL